MGGRERTDEQALRAEFESAGFVVLRGFLQAPELRDVRRDLERVIADDVPGLPCEEVYYETVGDPSSLKQIQRLHVHDEALSKWIHEGAFARLAQVLLGEEPAPQNLQYFDKAPGANRPTPPHQDGAYFPIEPMNAVTIWLALEDIGFDQGCVHYVAGSHREGLRAHRRGETLGFSREASSRPADRAREVGQPCAAGDVIAHHALTVHRADGNRSPDRHRRALGFIYYGSSCIVDRNAHAAYQARLDEELRATGRIGTNA